MGRPFKINDIIYRKLGKEKALGLAHGHDNIIEIDNRLRGKKKLEIIMHEVMHIHNPEWSESKVIKHSRALCNILWQQGYRCIDDGKSLIQV